MILNNIDAFSDLELAGEGYHAWVYKKDNHAIKVFNLVPYSMTQMQYRDEIDKKLDIIKNVDINDFVKIDNKYYCTKLFGEKIKQLRSDYPEKFLWAYEMEYLEDNILSAKFLNYLSIHDKKIILKKIANILKDSHNYDIYNFDLRISNFCLSKNGDFKAIDLDNLRIGEYDSLNKLTFVNEFIDIKDCNNDSSAIENYSYLRLLLDIMIWDFYTLIPYTDLEEYIDNLDCSVSFKQMANQILNNKQVDLVELVDSIEDSNCKRFIKTK